MTEKQPIVVDGMYGIGDNLHQRAVIRELMKRHDVYLISCHFSLYHDLVEQGLKVLFKNTRLRAQARTIAQEQHLFHRVNPPPHALRTKIWYNKPDIDKHGSILESIMGELGYRVPNPDFSLPIHPDWDARADAVLKRMKPAGTAPLMILRQLVLRREWNGQARNADPYAYGQIYERVRRGFWTLSIADIDGAQEWVEGPTLRTDAQIHDGSLAFGTMAGLYKKAALVMSPAGHGPVLAQAVGTPVIVVYGGRESYRTTQRAGAHLAPTLGIDPDEPCDCHAYNHNCKKKITLGPALERADAFLASLRRDPMPTKPTKTLIFTTTYVDCPDRQKLTQQWLTLTTALNPEADILIVDSKSPTPLFPPDDTPTFVPYDPKKTARWMLYTFPDNVGHLSRKGRDGWGRAFCFGLDAAIDGGYTHVVHIEGDLLFRLPTKPIVEEMKRTNSHVLSTPVKGMTREFANWVETALMFFSTEYLTTSNFTERYDWQRRQVTPTPEVVVRELVRPQLQLMPWRVLRGDKNQITHQNVVALDLDGITHCHNDVWTYDRFLEAALERLKQKEVVPADQRKTQPATSPQPRLKLNLGCGTNRLPDWENHDNDVDIRQRLPWPNDSVDLIFIEHCMEHVSYHQAVRFLEEAHRVLKPGGTIRVTVPSIEQIAKCDDPEYHKFTQRWGGEPTKRGALRAIIFAHGHEQAWTASLLHATMEYAGFTRIGPEQPGQSPNPELRNLEGHGKVIGDKFNRIESMPFEGTKISTTTVTKTATPTLHKTAIILGGAETVAEEYAQALELCRRTGIQPTVFMTNDQIEHHEGPGIATTLHPQKLPTWLEARQRKGYPNPTQVWSHMKANNLVTDITPDWAGSCGLFATKVAVETGHHRVLLCGVPMTQEGNHFQRHTPWTACNPFRRGWERNGAQFAARTRSFSGWTREKLGEPTEEWLVHEPTKG